MKRISLLFAIAVMSVSSLCAQPKWAIKASGAIGGSLNSASYERYYIGSNWHNHDRWDNVYDNSEMFYEGAIGVRLYALKWLYFGMDVSYSQLKNTYDRHFLVDIGASALSDRTLTLEGVGVSAIAGFTFPNKTRFYPFAEIGVMPYFTLTDDFHDKNVYLGASFKLGGGIKLTDKLALELAVSSLSLFKFDDEYYNSYTNTYYESEYLVEVSNGIGGSLGLVVSF